MVSVPTGHAQKRFSACQEASRKNIERAFGVMQQKFQILCHPFEKWDKKHISQMVMCCILLHNMMVQERVDSKDNPVNDNFCGMYNPHEKNDDANNQSTACDDSSIDDDAAQHVRHIEAEVGHHLQVIASHREADKHVYDSIVKDEKL